MNVFPVYAVTAGRNRLFSSYYAQNGLFQIIRRLISRIVKIRISVLIVRQKSQMHAVSLSRTGIDPASVQSIAVFSCYNSVYTAFRQNPVTPDI